MSGSEGRERTIIDAFRDLVGGRIEETRGLEWKVTRLSDKTTRLSNGIPYCFAEVTFGNGAQYGTEALGDEALALHIEASSYLDNRLEHEVPLLLAM